MVCSFFAAALGKPNTTLSKEALDEKKANQTGVEDPAKLSSSRSKHAAALASHTSNEHSNGNASYLTDLINECYKYCNQHITYS